MLNNLSLALQLSPSLYWLHKFQYAAVGMGNGTGIPWDTNPGTWDWDWDWFSWDAWVWNKYRLDSPETKISGTTKSQALGPLGTLVPWDFVVSSHAHPWC